MIAMHLTYTFRTPHPSSKWTGTGDDHREFAELATAKKWLQDQYWYCKKRLRCYYDTKDRGTVQSGWIYCFKERDGGKTTYWQHWVSLYEVDYRVVDVTAAA